ncbi:MAG: menaquinone biosynthesis decarboxylase, partial [SAR202 cluster bacterium]|nr:menaquinone biosynthesis decarboxylase [SAR202 cluster bacterium]
MRYKDLREFIAFLEGKGHLKRVKAQVNPELEITELADRMVKSGGPALLFENVKGHSMPVVIGLFAHHQRMAWALGVENVGEIAERVDKLLGMVGGPPRGIGEKVKALGDLMGLAKAQPKLAGKGPCQDVVLTGDQVDITKLPNLKCWPLDGGRYITLPLVISRDPRTGKR